MPATRVSDVPLVPFRFTFGLSLAAALIAPVAARAQSVDELSTLSIEELAAISVTSASKRAEPLSEVPASLYVITNRDILSAAATSLPEVLRLAPNLQVRQLDARQYAISPRGFNGYETANKLLARIDGRSIYTPLFSGVLWELHAPMLEDIEQIEVVSGPGGTLYGPNAVNGVVNIRTKDAFATTGLLARGTLGASERTAALRYGTTIGNAGAVRIYGSFSEREGLPDGAGPDVNDGFEGYQAGFRGDFEVGGSQVTVQGDIFDNRSDMLAGAGEEGHNLLARLTRETGSDASFQIQAYYDEYSRDFLWVLDSLQTFDAEAQFNATVGRHEFVLGTGVRTTKDEFVNSLNTFDLVPERRRLWVTNIFAQDEIALTRSLDLIAGVKLERSSFTGIQFLPNLRIAWQASPRTLLWGAVSRAVRTPARVDRQLQSLPILAPSDDFQSEKLVAVETGVRAQPWTGGSVSVSLFYNIYDDLRTTEFAPGNSLPIRLHNSLKGTTYGVEAWGTQQMTSWWRLKLGMFALGKDFEVKAGRVDLTDGESAGNDPDFQLLARSDVQLADDVSLDFGVRFVDDLPRPRLDSYWEADARLGWRVSEAVELFVAGRNLLHDTHAESPDPERAQLAERSVYGGTRLRF